MSTPQTVQQIELTIITQLVANAVAAGYYVSINNGGDADEIDRSTDPVAIMAVMRAADEDYVYLNVNPTGSDQADGWVRLVYGNGGYDVICDYSTGLEDFLTPINTLAATLDPDDQPYPTPAPGAEQ